MRSANPTLNRQAFQTAAPSGERMSIERTVYKTALLLAITVVTATGTWIWTGGDRQSVPGLGFTFVALLGLAFGTAFRPRIAIVTGPLYAVVSGAFVGVVTSYYSTIAGYEGIATQAVVATMGTFAAILFAYRTGLLRATRTFRKVVVGATLGILATYVLSFVLSFFGVGVPFIHDSGPIGILVSVGIVIVAALNLVLDFDFIERAAASGAEARMEWYGAFSLLVTLVWLYLEILRLIAKLRD